ncbi:MAG: hypothetical protein KJO31_02995 [Gammaproteobacteria bacterium]|nr:hypothetical protein [Gammaproteobacteria bacterium]
MNEKTSCCRRVQKSAPAISVLALLAVLVGGCDTTEQDWETAKLDGTRDAYTAFLKDHPTGSQSDEALRAIETLDWEAAESDGSSAMLKHYLKTYPDGRYVEQATSSMNELNQYRVVDTTEVVCSLKDFYYQGLIGSEPGVVEPTAGEIGSFECRLPTQTETTVIPLSQYAFAQGGVVTRDFGVFKVFFSFGSGTSIMLTGIQIEQLKDFLAE